jgi:hypothetical protein
LDQLEARLFFFLKQLDLEVDKKIDPSAGKNRCNFSCPWIFFDFRRNLSKLKIEIKSKIRWTECDKLLPVKLTLPPATTDRCSLATASGREFTTAVSRSY